MYIRIQMILENIMLNRKGLTHRKYNAVSVIF